MCSVESGSPCRSVVSENASWSTMECTPGDDISSVRNVDDSRDEVSMELHSKHWICVKQLERNTSDASLKKLFYPYGADEAFIIRDESSGLECIGYVGFDSPFMASLAAEKLNAFIPCGHSSPLEVRVVEMEEIHTARSRVHNVNKSLGSPSSTLLTGISLNSLTKFFERDPPASVATEMIKIIKNTPVEGLNKILSVLFHPLISGGKFDTFKDELSSQLMVAMLDSSACNESEKMGIALGNCYCNGWVFGDPFELAAVLIQDEMSSMSRAVAICAMTLTCSALTYPITKAAFWALVGQVALQSPNPNIKRVLLDSLRRLQFQTRVPTSIELFPNDSSSVVCQRGILSATSSNRYPTSNHKTLYLSHIPLFVTQRRFMELLSRGGTVNKVRVCVTSGYNTMFSFVEMQTVDGYNAVLKLNLAQALGTGVKIQPAKSPIQDVLPEDAMYSVDGTLQKPCLFGLTDEPLSSWPALH